MLVVRFIDITGIDVESAADNHILLAVHDVEVAVLIHRGDIARVAPAVSEQSRGFLRFVQIALGHLRTADNEFARLAYGHIRLALVQIDDAALRIRYGQADRTDFPNPFKRVGVRYRRGFRHAEAFTDDRSRRFFKIMNHFHGQRGAAGEEAFEAGHIGRLHLRMIQHADKHGRNQRAEVGLELADGIQKGLRLRFGNQDVAPSLDNGEIHRAGHAENMEEGQRAQVDIVSAGELGEPGANLLHLLADVAVRQDDALGNAGRAARILVHGDVVERQFDPGRVGL